MGRRGQRGHCQDRGDPATTPHLGASRSRLTLGTIQTTETLGGSREKGWGVRRGPSVRSGVPRPLNVTSTGLGGTHSVSLHAWQAGGSGETSSTLGETGGGDGGAGGAVPTPQHPVPKGGTAGGVPSCVSPGGRGDPALRGGRACQLHPEDKDTALVARPQARQLLLAWGGWQGQQAPNWGGDLMDRPLTSSPFLPGGPAGPRGPMGP